MSALWPNLKRWGKFMVAAVVFAAVVAAALVVYFTRRKREPDAGSRMFDAALDRASDRITEANAQAAVEIAIARTKDQALRHQLAVILDDPDGARRRASLVKLRRLVDIP